MSRYFDDGRNTTGLVKFKEYAERFLVDVYLTSMLGFQFVITHMI
jgi:hypothetical protein